MATVLDYAPRPQRVDFVPILTQAALLNVLLFLFSLLAGSAIVEYSQLRARAAHDQTAWFEAEPVRRKWLLDRARGVANTESEPPLPKPTALRPWRSASIIALRLSGCTCLLVQIILANLKKKDQRHWVTLSRVGLVTFVLSTSTFLITLALYGETWYFMVGRESRWVGWALLATGIGSILVCVVARGLSHRPYLETATTDGKESAILAFDTLIRISATTLSAVAITSVSLNTSLSIPLRLLIAVTAGYLVGFVGIVGQRPKPTGSDDFFIRWALFLIYLPLAILSIVEPGLFFW